MRLPAKPVLLLCLIHRPVAYYWPSDPSPLPIDDPHALPFLKHADFASQDEYRAIFGVPGGFRITRRIAQPQFSVDQEIAQASNEERLLKLARLRGIARIWRE